jgi:serine/threonine-protein kinase
MELLEGETVKERLARGPSSVSNALCIAKQVLMGLAHLLAVGMVHRDLKPANVHLQRLVTAGGVEDHVRILNFGLAKFLTGDARRDGPALTATGAVFRTAADMAPEQAAGGEVGPRADVYAAGVLLFELLAGRRPFLGEPHEVVRQHLLSPPPRIVDVRAERWGARASAGRDGFDVLPSHVEAVVARALAKEPAARFAHAGEMLPSLDDPAACTSMPTGTPEGSRDTTALRASRGAASVPAAAVLASPGGTVALPLVRPRARAPSCRGRPQRAFLIAGAFAIAVTALLVGVVGWRRGSRPNAIEPSRAPDGGAREAAPSGPGSSTERTVTGAVPETVAPENGPRVQRVRLPHATGSSLVSGDTREAVESVPMRDPRVEPMPPALLAGARRAHAHGRPTDPVLDRPLRSWHRTHPGDARGGLLLAHTYVLRGWRPDALAQYRLAFRRDPAAARRDPTTLRDLVSLAARAGTAEAASELFIDMYAEPAVAPAALAQIDMTLATARLDTEERVRLASLRARLAAAMAAPR